MQCVCLFSGVKINQCALKLGSEGCVGVYQVRKEGGAFRKYEW